MITGDCLVERLEHGYDRDQRGCPMTESQVLGMRKVD